MESLQDQLQRLHNHLQKLDAEKALALATIEDLSARLKAEEKNVATSSSCRTPGQKIAIFMSLFRGRLDVFPKRWENQKTDKAGYAPACYNEWVKGVCKKPTIKCSACLNQAFIPLTEDIIRKHLGGEGSLRREYTIGIYPMLSDETCWFLALDFDKEQWMRDVNAFLETCEHRQIPASLERSRSGRGAHVWIFFDRPVPAIEARKMGSALLTETMERCPELGFASYDRLFPHQDTLPLGGFGNLIALPLQLLPRQKANSVFLNRSFEPYPDQWAYLASVQRMKAEEVTAFVQEVSLKGRILNVRMAMEEDDERPWDMRPSRAKIEAPFHCKLPPTIDLILSHQVFIPKESLPPPIINKFIRLAAFQNPDFYKAQAMRLSTYGKPRIIACAEIFSNHIGLPRGCLDEALDTFASLGIKVNLQDKRQEGTFIDTRFLGTLNADQEAAAHALLAHETGVLAATTAFGKTVIAASMIAERKTNTLILVHRRQLLDQWRERLKAFLDLPSEQIGTIAAGKRKPTGMIDVAMVQSLIKKHAVDDSVADYGQIIVDECHHLSAVSFEAVTRACKAKYMLGLTATATRKDGHHPIIFMQCGPIRHRVDAKKQASLRPFTHTVVFRPTAFYFSSEVPPTIQQLYAALSNDHDRNQMILDDVLRDVQKGRSPLLLTERKDRALALADQLSSHCQHVIVMVGGQTAKQRQCIQEQLSSIPESEARVVVATGRYIGEGYDDARLDTLFLTLPISWHGTLAQYAGRLHRLYHSKKDVVIYDYIDQAIPMLAKMADKRKKGYEKLGYSIA